MTVRKAEAQWRAACAKAAAKSHSRAARFRGPYTFKARFEDGKETNPEELLGAAHAACFTMAMTAMLARQQLAPTKIQTTASCHLTQVAGGFSIRASNCGHARRSQGSTPEIRGPAEMRSRMPGIQGSGRCRDLTRREARMTGSILYGNRESGHCYKVKLALVLAELLHEYREVDLDVPFEQRRDDFRAVSRFGEVPGLRRRQPGAVTVRRDPAVRRRAQRQAGGELPLERLTEWLFWEANRIGFSVPNLRRRGPTRRPPRARKSCAGSRRAPQRSRPPGP
jgi:OsmC subfamily peroxiredoxin